MSSASTPRSGDQRSGRKKQKVAAVSRSRGNGNQGGRGHKNGAGKGGGNQARNGNKAVEGREPRPPREQLDVAEEAPFEAGARERAGVEGDLVEGAVGEVEVGEIVTFELRQTPSLPPERYQRSCESRAAFSFTWLHLLMARLS